MSPAPALRRTGGLLAAAALALAGCAGYRLGTTLPPDIHSVHVPTFVNQSGEPLVETEATRACIQELQRDGTLRVGAAGDADTVLLVTVTKYSLDPIRYERDAAKTTEEYRLSLLAHIVFKRATSGAVLLDRWVTGETTFDPAGDLSSAKTAALPNASRDLAHNIVESVVEYW